MKSLRTPQEVESTPATGSAPERTVEERLIALLKDGMCDLYSAVAVLEAATGRIQVNTEPKHSEHLYVAR